MSVGQFCKRNTVVIGKQESIVAAAKLMRQHHIGSLIVVEKSDGNKPIGILTDRDLVIEVLAEEINPDEVTVGDIMSFELVTAHEQDGLYETLKSMKSNGVRRVPVVDSQGQVVGILSWDDVLELLATEMNELAQLAGSERQREKKVRPPV